MQGETKWERNCRVKCLSWARQNGAFEGIDFLKSNFCGYLVNFQYTTSRGIGEKTLHVSPELKEKFYNNINNGKQYY